SDCAAMRLHDLAVQIQPDPGAAGAVPCARHRVLDTEVLLEDTLSEVGGDAGSAVVDRDAQGGAARFGGDDCVGVLWAVLERVREHVGTRRAEAGAVTAPHGARLDGDAQRDAALFEARLEPAYELREH